MGCIGCYIINIGDVVFVGEVLVGKYGGGDGGFAREMVSSD